MSFRVLVFLLSASLEGPNGTVIVMTTTVYESVRVRIPPKISRSQNNRSKEN